MRRVPRSVKSELGNLIFILAAFMLHPFPLHLPLTKARSATRLLFLKLELKLVQQEFSCAALVNRLHSPEFQELSEDN